MAIIWVRLPSHYKSSTSLPFLVDGGHVADLKSVVVVVLDGVREGVEVGRWRLQLAADGIAMVLDDVFLLLC